MFESIYKKKVKDKYIEEVALILNNAIGSALPLKNAYTLAEECLRELRNYTLNETFCDDPNPRVDIMAYYSLCSLINESSSTDDKSNVLKTSVMAKILKEKLDGFEEMSLLENSICRFGEHVLSFGLSAPTEESIELIKNEAVQVIMEFMKDQELIAKEQDVEKIVKNVSSKVGDREVLKVGENILAVSVLSNAAGYYIDQGETDMANSYFMCIGKVLRKYFEGRMEKYSDYQKHALQSVMRSYGSLAEELMD